MQDHAPGLERAFGLDVVEDDYQVTGIEGEVPSFLRGSYYLNGPALFGRGEVRYRHWLDGDGLVTALHFGPDGVRLVNRLVRSTKYLAEEEAGRSLYRAFGTGFEGDLLKRSIGLESPVNVSAFRWGEVLLAFGEQGLPYELDPVTLETRGEYTFDGRLNAISPLSAHPCFDPQSGEMLNFGISFAAKRPCLHLYRFRPPATEGGAANDDPLVYRRRLDIPYPASVHDFILSPQYAIFHLSPYLLDVEGLIRRGKTVMEALSWEPERGGHLLIARRQDGAHVHTLEIGSGFCLHLVNAFEENGRLVVDVVELERPIYDQYQVLPNLFLDAPRGRPTRRVVDLEAGAIVEEKRLDYSPAPDFPAVDPRQAQCPYDDFWMLGISATGQPGRKFFDQVAHLSWSAEADVYSSPAGRYLGGEPVFCGDPGGGAAQGAVICQEFDAATRSSAFLIFDAQKVAAGPVARLPLRDPVALRFHASWHAAERA